MRTRNFAGALALSICALGLLATSALAVPSWGIELSNEPTELPRTDEGMHYEAIVTNTAGTTADVGDVLSCKSSGEEAGFGNPTPTYTRQWLRGGEEIPGETGKTYTVTEADKSKGLQCKVTATSDADGAGTTYNPISRQAVSLPPLVVAPAPTPALPTGSLKPEIAGGLLALPTGTATTTAGSNLLTDVVTAKGTGTLTAGSKTVTGVTTESGVFHGDGGGTNGGDIISGPGLTASGSGTFTQGSFTVTGVTTDTGTFAAGQFIVGTGTPLDGYKINEVSPGTLALNGGAAASGTFSFSTITRIAGAGVDTLTLSAAASVSGLQAFVAGTHPFGNGQTINGPGIPPGTAILEVATGGPRLGREIVMSNNATATASGVTISATSTNTCKAPKELKDSPNGWSGDGLTWSFQWLRNGEEIPGATSATYTVTEADVKSPSALQCEATVEDASGNKAVVIQEGLTAPQWPAPYSASSIGIVTVPLPNDTTGPVTLEVELPAGQEETFVYKVSGWPCKTQPPTGVTPAKVICTRDDSLTAGESYLPLLISLYLGADAPDTGTAVATVSGGGASNSASDEATYSFGPGYPFGILQDSFKATVFDDLGNVYTKAGGHPHAGYATFGFNVRQRVTKEIFPSGSVKDTIVDVPRGFVGNALATPELCDSIEAVILALCPPLSFVGGIDVYTTISPPTKEQIFPEKSLYPNLLIASTFGDLPIYSLEPEFGQPAQFAFAVNSLEVPYTFVPELRPDEGYAISFRTAPVIMLPALYGTNVNLCDFGAKIKGTGQNAKFNGCNKATDAAAYPNPLIANPTRCTGPPPVSGLRVNSWQHPEDIKTYDFVALPITDCEEVKFEPESTLEPTNRQADSPTGLNVEFSMPTDGLLSPTGVAQATLDNATVTFPKGMAINSATADGLGSCSPEQVQLKTNAPAKCPDSSKVGVIEIDTPLIRETLHGGVYVARQNDNPFNAPLGLYMVFSSERDGVTVKIAGKLTPDPDTGQLVSTFVENPEWPFSRLVLKFNSGPRAPLINPPRCGTYAIRAEFSPWSAVNPANPTPDEIVVDDSTYKVTRGPNNSACPNGNLEPKLSAGTEGTQAGAKSPFVLSLSREDGTQRFSGLEVANPRGLTAYLKGVSICPESSLANVSPAEEAGALEVANPSCPANSLVGTTQAGSGSGPLPFYVKTGKVYLAGPYKGAPISLATITPAVAGPYDLGNVLIRVALHVDPETAQVRAVSDPIPTALHDIALNIRDIRVRLDRPGGFTANPTNCEPSSVDALVKGAEGATANLSNRFQVGGCENLGFKPKLSFRLFGGTKRGAFPKFRAILRARPGDANIAKASVALPRTEFLEQGHIRTICTRVQFAADSCPQGSIYGEASATTPLLDGLVSGPVYLRSSSNELPDLVASLRGPDTQPIEVALVGRIDSVNGGIRSNFDVVPDQPVSSFTLTMQGGKKGLLVNSRDLCKTKKPPRATAAFTAQNGRQITLRPELKNACKKATRKGRGKRKGQKRR